MCRILERKTREAFIGSQFKILLALVYFGLRKIFNPTNTVHGSIHDFKPITEKRFVFFVISLCTSAAHPQKSGEGVVPFPIRERFVI